MEYGEEYEAGSASGEEVDATEALPVSGVAADPEALTRLDDANEAVFTVHMGGTYSKFETGVSVKVDPEMFTGPATGNHCVVQCVEISRLHAATKFPVALILTDGARQIPVLNPARTVATKPRERCLTVIAQNEKFRRPLLVASPTWDAEQLAFFAATYKPGTIASNVESSCRDYIVSQRTGLKKRLAFPDSPLVSELRRTFGADQFNVHNYREGGYVLDAETYKVGMGLVQSRLDSTPEVDLASLYFCGKVPDPASVPIPPPSNETFQITFRVRILYKSIREVTALVQ